MTPVLRLVLLELAAILLLVFGADGGAWLVNR